MRDEVRCLAHTAISDFLALAVRVTNLKGS